MAVFPLLDFELTVQVGDKTRLKADKSFSPTANLTTIEIKPSADDDFVEVTDVDGWYLDWVYLTEGSVTVTARASDGVETETKDFTLTVVSEEADALLSTDSDLKTHESNILDLLKEGRSSFKDVHRRARKLIVDFLSRENIRNGTGNALEVTDILDVSALKDWATYLALRLIFADNITQAEDKFERKEQYYKAFEDQAKSAALMSVEFDEDGDGVADNTTPNNFNSVKLVRR